MRFDTFDSLLLQNGSLKSVKKGTKFLKKVLQFRGFCDIIICVAITIAHRGIAQLVEYRSPKPWVAGSNPPAPAKNPARKCGIFTFYLLTLHFSLKRQDFWQVKGNSEE